VAPHGEEGAASGILSTLRQVGGVFGVAILGAVFATAMTSNMIGATSKIPGLPAEAVPYVTQTIENSGSQMGMGMGGMDVASLRDTVPAEAMRPLTERAVTDAAEQNLPADVRGPVVKAVMAEIDKGTSLEGKGMMTVLGPLMGQMAAIDPAADATAFMNFGTSIGTNLEKAYTAIGDGFADASKQSFVDAVGLALRVASGVLLVGALLSLLITPGKNVALDVEQTEAI
jgi:hypothetical protein